MAYYKHKVPNHHLNKWEKSLWPHQQHFFPGVPPFKSTLLQLQLGLEITSSSSSSSSSSWAADLISKGILNLPKEHFCCEDRNYALEKHKQPSNFKEGDTFPLEDYLVDTDDDEGHYLVRKDGTTLVHVDSLENKHVLLCCFSVPLYWSIHAIPYARTVSSLCAELATSKIVKEECEMVIVAKMTPHWANNKAAFDHFFKAFPDSCLTVPFHHKKRINRICQSLNRQSFYPRSVFIGPDKKVLLTGIDHFWNYGIKDLYPFSNELPTVVDKDCKSWFSATAVDNYYKSLLSVGGSSSGGPLATLLGGWDPLPSDLRLRDVLTGEERISISELEEKDVGLYLCCKGDLLDKLSEVYHHCKNQGRYGNFEVVVVWFPDVTGLGKSEFEQLMTAAFELRGLSCLVLPFFDNSVVRRLIRISGDLPHDTVNEMSDRLLIVGAHGSFVNPIADVLIRLWDVDAAYPFSLAHLVDKVVKRLGEVNLDSILGKVNSAVRVENKQVGPIITREELKANLKGKRVFLYLANVEKRESAEDEDDPWWRCKEIKHLYPDCEVLYVQPCETVYESDDFEEGLSLYMCPYYASLCKFVDDITSVAGLDLGCSLGFGYDGHIASLGLGNDPFAETLREDVLDNVFYYNICSTWMGNDHALFFLMVKTRKDYRHALFVHDAIIRV